MDASDCCPTVFPLVKSKCFSDLGHRICLKLGHSCWRRVINCCQLPAARGWRTISRAGRFILQQLDVSCETWSMDQAATDLVSMVASLEPKASHHRCRRCQALLPDHTQLVTADLDQAFERCSARRVLRAWQLLLGLYRATFPDDTHVLVRRGKKNFARRPERGHGGRGW